jgi:hypothetical protein
LLLWCDSMSFLFVCLDSVEMTLAFFFYRYCEVELILQVLAHPSSGVNVVTVVEARNSNDT